MKLKYYLRGLGIGILVTTLMFTIGIHFTGGDVSDDEIIKRAEALGMTMAESETEKTISEALREKEQGTETETLSSEEDKDTTDTQAAEYQTAIQPDAGAEQPGEDATQPTDTAQPTDVSQPTAPAEAVPVEFSINKGEVPRIVATNLVAAGLIDNADTFNQYLKDQGLDNELQIGTYQILPGSDYATIVSILTTNNN